MSYMGWTIRQGQRDPDDWQASRHGVNISARSLDGLKTMIETRYFLTMEYLKDRRKITA